MPGFGCPWGTVMETADGPRARRYRRRMKPISYARHRFPPEVIRHAVWLNLRFTLSLPRRRGASGRARGSTSPTRPWVAKFGSAFRPQPAPAAAAAAGVGHLAPRRDGDLGPEPTCIYLWRAVRQRDFEARLLDLLVQPSGYLIINIGTRLILGGPPLKLVCAKLLKKSGAAAPRVARDRQAALLCGREARTRPRRAGMNRACARTTGPRTRISPSEDENGRCKASSRRDQPQRFLSSHAAVHNALRPPAPPHVPTSPAPVQGGGRGCMGDRDRGGLIWTRSGGDVRPRSGYRDSAA